MTAEATANDSAQGDGGARRVLLMAACLADAAPAIDLAVAAARRLQASLEGVLAQDPRAEGAALVAAGAGSSAEPGLSPERLRAGYAIDARAFRQRLNRAAAGSALRWGFRTETGPLLDLALRPRRPGDALILGHRRFLAVRGPLIALAGDEAGPEPDLATDLALALRLRLRRLPTDTALAEIELLSASLIVLPPALQADPQRLRRLIEAARCPVLLSAR